MEDRQSKLESFKDFLVGLKALAVFLFCTLLLGAALLLCAIGTAILSPLLIIILAILLSIGGTILLLVVSYFLIKAVGKYIRSRKKIK